MMFAAGRPAGIEVALGFAQIRRLEPRHPGAALFGAGRPVSRRHPRFWLRQRRQVETQPARHRVDRDDMRNDADRLDILFCAETASEHAPKPTFAEAAGIGAHAMYNLDNDFGQSAEAVMLTFDRCRRQRLFAPPAERA
jgi:hypothetical protein